MPPARRPSEGALSGAFYALLAQLTTAVFTTVVTLYLVRTLGPEGYGELALALSVGGMALVLADAAIAQSCGRYAASSRSDPELINAVISSGLRLKMLFGAAAVAALVLLAGPIARAYGEPAMTWALRAAALSVAGESLMLLWLVTFAALRRQRLTVRLYLVESAAEAVAILTLVTLGAGVTGAVLGRAIGYAIGAVAGGLLVLRLLGQRPQLRGHRQTRRQVLRYARPLFVSNSIYTTYGQVDVQLIAALLGRSFVGLYAAPMRIIVLLGMPGTAVANAVSPRMAGNSPEVGVFSRALRGLLLYQIGLMAPLLVWAEPITVLILGEAYRGSAVVLAGMAPFVLLNGLSVLVSTTVNYLGHARRRIPIVVLALALNAALDVVLLPTIGVLGAAVGTSVSYAVYVGLHVRICASCFSWPWRALAATAGRGALAALACGCVLAALGAPTLTPLQAVTGLVAGTLTFLTVLLATGEITSQDTRSLVGFLTRLTGRRTRPADHGYLTPP